MNTNRRGRELVGPKKFDMKTRSRSLSVEHPSAETSGKSRMLPLPGVDTCSHIWPTREGRLKIHVERESKHAESCAARQC